MNAGFTITKQGWRLLAKLVAGATLEISRVMVGSGKLAEGINPGELTDLVQPVALATSTVPQVADKQVSFIVEYRSDLNGDRRESSEPQSGESGGLAEGFWLNEFGVFANDPDEGEVLLYYATMGDYPQYVSAYNGSSVDIRRYPVSIALSDCEDVQLSYPAGALVTAEEMAVAFAERGVPPSGLEGQMLVKAGADSATPTKWGPWPSNPNLLINGDFRKPVNRNGKMEYIGIRYSIDMWQIKNPNISLTILDDSIQLTSSGIDNSSLVFSQEVNMKQPEGQVCTLSALVKGNGILRNLGGGSKSFSTTDFELIQLPIAATNITEIQVRLLSGQSAEVKAIKLEPGDQQTLAHKDADGNWVLNDPPNYDLQYLLCSQYSPSTGEFVGSQHSNENLLINYYLADPINQRSITEAIMNSNYCIDCWFLQRQGHIKILDDKSVIFWSDAADYSSLVQKIENLELGKIYTLSALLDNNKFITVTNVLTNNPNTGITIYVNDDIFRAYNNMVEIIIRNANHFSVETAMKIIAIKLELGPVQTLAHKEGDVWVLNDPPPNKALELAKCQRYQNKIGGLWRASRMDANSFQFYIPIPVTMRSNPVLRGTYGILKINQLGYIDGFTYETNIANNAITIYATKTAHGLTDAVFYCQDVIADANL